MTREIFDKLTNSKSSWALWPEDDWSKINLEKYFLDNITTLKPNIIFLGLNKSKNTINDYSNFHTSKHSGDKTLSNIICKLKNLSGGFMTDICSEIESDSNRVKINNKEIDNFINQIISIDEQKLKIICFGDKVYETLKERFDIEMECHYIKLNMYKFWTEIQNISLEFYRVWHYSNYGKYQFKINELIEQLNYINNYE